MQLNITCHNIKITPAIEDHIRNKFQKIINHFNNVIDVKFTLTVEKKIHVAESTIHMPKNNIHAEARDNDMYRAIDGVISKLDIKRKFQIIGNKNHSSLKTRIREIWLVYY